MSQSRRFFLTPSRSPTYYNLSHHLKKQNWSASYFAWRAHFSERHFQFDLNCTQSLEFKHLLAQLVAQYCQHTMPLTYCINDDNWRFVLENILQENKKEIAEITWILKPALINNGQYLKIFENLNQVRNHYLSSNRLGGEHVLQQYITNPHLLQGPKLGHKYSIRMFLVLSNTGAYLYPQGYFNIALEPYKIRDFSDLTAHLTNEHLLGSQANVVQIPTQQYPFFKDLYPQIKNITSDIIKGLQQAYPFIFQEQKQRTLAIFGFDFMVDNAQRVWLLEANHAPCFPVDANHPLQKILYDSFWEAVIEYFVKPIAYHQRDLRALSVFESCLTN